MNRPIRAGDYVEHFDPELPHHRAWLQAVLEQLVGHDPQALEEGGTLRRLCYARQAAAGEGPAPVAEIPVAVAIALPLVKEFEGCWLTAYPDPETGGRALDYRLGHDHLLRRLSGEGWRHDQPGAGRCPAAGAS